MVGAFPMILLGGRLLWSKPFLSQLGHCVFLLSRLGAARASGQSPCCLSRALTDLAISALRHCSPWHGHVHWLGDRSASSSWSCTCETCDQIWLWRNHAPYRDPHCIGIATVPRVRRRIKTCLPSPSSNFRRFSPKTWSSFDVKLTNRLIEQTAFNGGFVAGFEQLEHLRWQSTPDRSRRLQLMTEAVQSCVAGSGFEEPFAWGRGLANPCNVSSRLRFRPCLVFGEGTSFVKSNGWGECRRGVVGGPGPGGLCGQLCGQWIRRSWGFEVSGHSHCPTAMFVGTGLWAQLW